MGRILLKILLSVLVLFVGSMLLTATLMNIPIAHGVICVIGMALIFGGIGLVWKNL